MVKVTSLLIKAGSGLEFSSGVRAWTEMDKSSNNLGFKAIHKKY